MTQQQEPILQVHNLSFGFEKNKPILKNISFSIEKGAFVLLTGPNGSGKSLLLKCVKGLLKPTEGTVTIEGQDVTRAPKKRLDSIGLVFQDADSQIVGQTVERDILFGVENLRLPQEEQMRRLEEVGTLMGLKEQFKQRPRTLSGGEKRRLSIAGVLVMDPKLLIMDEPFANLDYPSVLQVIKTLLKLHEAGHTIILVSHEVEKILAYTDQTILLEKGSVIADGKAIDILPLLPEHGVYVPLQAKIEELTWLKQ
ncbi:ABC-type cobalt transport system, ATPase component [Sphaerochaeta pleomorpha str. Grapes]|uniref:ABC-type cobalt transport system, ATPase component n=1 Tax=Sphaerochaeta pleomorpha (strain ATCC BAA-1885 / DSM 22778 / Grapes) TaxID=158190 RepID=G8QVB7_SPHPG|nr:ABC transporter ATP-binding protein [Sphaerochaeta pleomorpha]AEV30432.1 ABC-type cobalt transport system, ATPase component [Sphaerochaeta pleomorpha str. Grapes]